MILCIGLDDPELLASLVRDDMACRSTKGPDHQAMLHGSSGPRRSAEPPTAPVTVPGSPVVHLRSPHHVVLGVGRSAAELASYLNNGVLHHMRLCSMWK